MVIERSIRPHSRCRLLVSYVSDHIVGVGCWLRDLYDHIVGVGCWWSSECLVRTRSLLRAARLIRPHSRSMLLVEQRVPST